MARRSKGALYKRDRKGDRVPRAREDTTPGKFYLEYYAAGTRHREALRDRNGQPITTRPVAEARRAEVLHPLEAANDVRRLQQIRHALEDATAEGAEALERAREKLPLAAVWDCFPYDHSTPKKHSKRRRKLSAKSTADNRALWGKFVDWMASRDPRAFLEDVKSTDAEAYSRHIREVETLTNGRHNKLIRTASVIFRLAGRPDPFADVDLYQAHYESREHLTRDELQQVINKADGEMRRLFIIATYSGLRMGDCATLDWKSIQLPHNRLIRATAKTGRTVSLPLHPDLRAELEKTPAKGRSGPVCPDLAARYARDPSSLSKATRRAFQAAGLDCVEPGAGRKRRISRRGFHSFRHSFCTICAQERVPIGAIRDWIGHSSSMITEIYSHWSERETEAEILRALPRIGKRLPAAAKRRAELREIVENMTDAEVAKWLPAIKKGPAHAKSKESAV